MRKAQKGAELRKLVEAEAKAIAQSLSIRSPDHPNTARAVSDIYPEVLLQSMRAIISSLEEKDPYTHGHSIRSSEYAVLLGKELGLTEKEIKELELATLFHDIGKIGIPDYVLTKPSRLTFTEFEIMKSHPVRSAKIIEKITVMACLVPGIKHHHERWDGLGYPSGLKGEEIPLYGRIILVVDTYDAMTSTRPYRLALEKNIAIQELIAHSGTQFDPKIVKAMVNVLRRKDPRADRVSKTTLTKKIA